MSESSPNVYDGPPINEYYWQWLDVVDIEEGDLLTVETETKKQGWGNPLTVTNAPYPTERIELEGPRGAEYILVTYTNNHPLEPDQPILRKKQNNRSLGIIERLVLYKKP